MRTCAEPDCGRKHQARGYCGSHYNMHFPNVQRQAPVPCTVCGTMVMKDKRDHTKRRPVCSDMCRTYLRLGRWPMCLLSQPKAGRTRREAALTKLARTASLPPLRKRWYVGRCKRCGAWFTHDQPRTNWCSDICGRRAARAVRRAVTRRAFIENVRPSEIFERDRWQCRLCRKPVARTKTVPHPKAPVLDHVLPLAQGGKHERANLQCAHFICNSIKRDRAANDQFMLFG